MTFLRLHEILAAILDLYKLYLLAQLRSLWTFSMLFKGLYINIPLCQKFSCSLIPVDPFWGQISWTITVKTPVYFTRVSASLNKTT